MRILHKNTFASDPEGTVVGRRLAGMPARSVRSTRRGGLLVEIIVGCVLLGVFLMAAVPLVSWVRTSRLAVDNQQLAVTELANLMERVAGVPAADRTTERLQQLTLSESAQTTLDDAQLAVAATPSEQFSGLRRITLSLTWTNLAGQRVQPVELSAWFAAARPEPND